MSNDDWIKTNEIQEFLKDRIRFNLVLNCIILNEKGYDVKEYVTILGYDPTHANLSKYLESNAKNLKRIIETNQKELEKQATKNKGITIEEFISQLELFKQFKIDPMNLTLRMFIVYQKDFRKWIESKQHGQRENRTI